MSRVGESSIEILDLVRPSYYANTIFESARVDVGATDFAIGGSMSLSDSRLRWFEDITSLPAV